MWPHPQFLADLVTFTDEILHEKLHFEAVFILATHPVPMFLLMYLTTNLTDFNPLFHFYSPWKGPKNLWFSDVFRGYRNETLGLIGLIKKWKKNHITDTGQMFVIQKVLINNLMLNHFLKFNMWKNNKMVVIFPHIESIICLDHVFLKQYTLLQTKIMIKRFFLN